MVSRGFPFRGQRRPLETQADSSVRGWQSQMRSTAKLASAEKAHEKQSSASASKHGPDVKTAG
jgi:hypothetical protein